MLVRQLSATGVVALEGILAHLVHVIGAGSFADELARRPVILVQDATKLIVRLSMELLSATGRSLFTVLLAHVLDVRLLDHTILYVSELLVRFAELIEHV